MPGSGKTTIGKQLAQELNFDFVDLDVEIESHEQQSVNDIFNTKGEDHFRMTESKLLKEWASSSKSFVMATGGGAPCFFQGIDTINRTGVSIFLDVPLDVLVRHTAKRSTRPLLKNSGEDELKTKLNSLLEKRLPVYQHAHIRSHKLDVKSILKQLNIRK